VSIVRKVSDSFTRPSDTTAYADNDLVANSTTAGSVVPLSFNVGRGGVKIVGARIQKSDESDVANATFTLHLFGSSPTVANGDNGAISHSLSDKFGSISFATMTAATDEGYALANGGDTILPDGLYWYTSNGRIYALIQAEAAYSPASAEVFAVTLIYEKT
jgi:hypothetical protein